MQNEKLEPYSLKSFGLYKIINNPIHRYNLDNIYYTLDGQNIFKRVDRYRNKLFLKIVFCFLIFVNFHEILYNIILYCIEIDPENLSFGIGEGLKYYYWNIISEYLCNFYILAILILSFYTVCKFGIDTKIYY